MEAGALSVRGDRSVLGRSPLSRLPDRALKWGLTGLAAGILVLIGYFFVRLYIEANPAFSRFGFFGFAFGNDWNVSANHYGALPLLVGTIVSSAVALVIGVPVAVAPALALGATRWEMIRMAVLPYSRAGISGASMLGLGRAIGETIAVTIVIGNAPNIGKQLFDQGYTLAAVIANEFGEAASTPIHRAALIAAGLVLFVLTLLVNLAARYFVVRGTYGRRPTPELVAAAGEGAG